MTYRIKRGDSLSGIAARHKVTLPELLAANPRFKADPDRISVGDRLEIPGGRSRPRHDRKKNGAKKQQAARRTRRRRPAPPPDTEDDFTVPFGQLTFDAEGQEKPGRFFSRRLHVPGPWSGATIGRGYDMRERSEDEIIADLTAAGVSRATARKLAGTRGLRGKKAREFIRDRGLDSIELTPRQQKALFILTYRELEGDVVRICGKADVVAKYGALSWDRLNARIRDLLVDLRYRGDYTGATREKVQPPAVRNDLGAFARVIADETYWVGERNVPRDRFRRRRKYLRND